MFQIGNKPLLALILFLSIQYSHAEQATLRIATVFIVQQDDFLAYVLEPFVTQNNLSIQYSSGHHSEVARMAARGDADLVITHNKVRKMHTLVSDGVLNKGQPVFANPMAFLGPTHDPARINGMKDPVAAVKTILQSGHCFLINNHDRLEKQQKKLIEKANVDNGCIIDTSEQNETLLDSVYEKNGYTIWGLHPYARRGENRLLPIVVPEKSLLMVMTAWSVTETRSKALANKLIVYMKSATAKQRIISFRLKNYPDIQAWWNVE